MLIIAQTINNLWAVKDGVELIAFVQRVKTTTKWRGNLSRWRVTLHRKPIFAIVIAETVEEAIKLAAIDLAAELATLESIITCLQTMPFQSLSLADSATAFMERDVTRKATHSIVRAGGTKSEGQS